MISIIVPIYNEEKTIEQVVKRLEKLKLPVTKEIILINDGSKDSTDKVLKKLKKRNKKLTIISYEKNRGKGFAVRQGLNSSKGDILLIQDADLEYNLSNIHHLLKEILQNKEEVVYGSRFLKSNKKGKLAYYLGNRLLSFTTSFLYFQKITDMETCYKMFTRKVLKNIILTSDRFEIEPEITAKIIKKGYKIKEIAIDYNPRSRSEGKKIKAKDGLIAIWTLLKLRICN